MRHKSPSRRVLIRLTYKGATLSSLQLARVIGVSQSTVQEWVKSGEIPTDRPCDDLVDSFLRERLEREVRLALLRETGIQSATIRMRMMRNTADTELFAPVGDLYERTAAE